MNENLRQALLRARLREQDVAASLDVDPKTVRRWIEGRIPYPANRAALADLLHTNEANLWPESSNLLSSRSRPDELVAVYPHRWAIPREAWVHFFGSAEREIGILAYSALFLAEDAGILRLLANKSAQGVNVRIVLGDPESPQVAERGVEELIGNAMSAKIRNALTLYHSLQSIPNAQIRLHRTILYNSIYRADDALLVNHHTYGVPGAHAPVIELRKTDLTSMRDAYLNSFEVIWQSATLLC